MAELPVVGKVLPARSGEGHRLPPPLCWRPGGRKARGSAVRLWTARSWPVPWEGGETARSDPGGAPGKAASYQKGCGSWGGPSVRLGCAGSAVTTRGDSLRFSQHIQ